MLWDLILMIIALVLPPLAVFFKRGIHSAFWLSIVLTILGWIPGVIFAFWEIILYRHRHYHYRPRRFGGSLAPSAGTPLGGGTTRV